VAQSYIRIQDSERSPPTAPHLLFDRDAIDPAHVGSRLEQFSDHVRFACFPPKVYAGARLCGAGPALRPIETTSCAVDAESHLNATIVAEVVTTFSSFQVP